MRRHGTALDPLRRAGPPVPVDTIWVPKDVELEGEELIWRAKDGRVQCSEKRPGGGLLESFLGLRDGTAEEVRRFAARWGPLGLGETRLPVSRSFPWKGPNLRRAENWQTVVDWPETGYRETVAKWRGYAAHANALLRLSSTLRSGKRGSPEDWAFVHNGPAWEGVDFDQLSSREALALEWASVVFALQQWMAWGSVRPNVNAKWHRVPASIADRAWRLRLTLSGERLLGALAVQLVFAASRARAIYLCDGCGKEYRPSRMPSDKTMRYCAKCTRNGVPGRNAARAYYARNRAKISKRRKERRATKSR